MVESGPLIEYCCRTYVRLDFAQVFFALSMILVVMITWTLFGLWFVKVSPWLHNRKYKTQG